MFSSLDPHECYLSDAWAIAAAVVVVGGGAVGLVSRCFGFAFPLFDDRLCRFDDWVFWVLVDGGHVWTKEKPLRGGLVN